MDRKRPKDERELVQRYKVFAKLQTALDFEILTEGLICKLFDPSRGGSRADQLDEHNLRKRIAELQEYRRVGITTAAEAEAYDHAKAARVSIEVLGIVSNKLTNRLGTAHSSLALQISCPLALESMQVNTDSYMASLERRLPALEIVENRRLEYQVRLVVNLVSSHSLFRRDYRSVEREIEGQAVAQRIAKPQLHR